MTKEETIEFLKSAKFKAQLSEEIPHYMTIVTYVCLENIEAVNAALSPIMREVLLSYTADMMKRIIDDNDLKEHADFAIRFFTEYLHKVLLNLCEDLAAKYDSSTK
jgi:hypothetical protein